MISMSNLFALDEMPSLARLHTHSTSTVQIRLLLPLLLCLLLLHSVEASAAPIGTVISLTPGVSVLRGGETIPLAVKDPIEAHDTITSNASGKAQIIFNDDSTVTLANNTSLSMDEFSFDGTEPAFKSHVGQGLIRVITGKIVEQNPDGFNLTTPQATIGIRGTVLDVSVDENRTTVFVENTLHKEVYVNNTQVPQGQRAIVDATGAAPTLQPITPDEQENIDTETTVVRTIAPPAGGIAAISPGPVTDLARANLPQQALGDDLTPLPAPPVPPIPPAIIATVSGSMVGSPAGPYSSGIGSEADYAPTFSFSVNMTSGAIFSATMTGSSNTFAMGSGLSYNLHSGSGNMSAGTFSINNYSGTVNYPLANPALPITPNDPSIYMNGTGNIATVGGTVSGTFRVGGNGTTGWFIDDGTFSGVRTP